MEPQANKSSSPPPNGQLLRFVVLRHDGYGPLHWDLMIEIPNQDKLATWHVTTPPEQWGPTITGQRIADHRRAYLEYQGEISANRGQVTRIAQGNARWDGDVPLILLGQWRRIAV